MTATQYEFAVSEAAKYSSSEEFVAGVLSSAAFSKSEATGEDEWRLRMIWIVASAPFREFLAAIGLSQQLLVKRYLIPRRTVQNWCAKPSSANHTRCPVYLRLLIAESKGFVVRPS